MKTLPRIVRAFGNRSNRSLTRLLESFASKPPTPAAVAPERRILFVCYGNSCRSPLAHGILRAKLADAGLLGRVLVDSAGTHPGDPGAPPDWRARRAARNHGLRIGDLRARRFEPGDFDRFDRILVFDQKNRDALMRLARTEKDRDRVSLVSDGEVADPAFGTREGFNLTFSEIDHACELLVQELRSTLSTH